MGRIARNVPERNPETTNQSTGQGPRNQARRGAFQDAGQPDPQMRSNLKITNEASSVQTPGPSRKQTFDKVATEAHERSEEYKKRAYELGKEFVRILEDRVLPENKGPTAKSYESQKLNELLMLGVEMNLDERQDEGMGSIGIITLLVKGLILQRDRINFLSYRVEKTEQILKQIQKDIQPVQVPIISMPVQPNHIPIRMPESDPIKQNDPIHASRDPGRTSTEG